MSTHLNVLGGGGGGGRGTGRGEGEGFGAYAYSFLASPPPQKMLCCKTISDMSVPLCLQITEVIPTYHNTLHVGSDRGRLSTLIDELESGTWLT